MFEKILIANRGEIAIRIIRTCRKLNIKTVAVYSDIDARSLHVREADEAVHIGPSPSPSSYLAYEKIIKAAVDQGCQAIHPGYGFLSENSAFAAAVVKAGLVFIGPSSEVIAALGDKISAKNIAMKAGVPVVLGHNLPIVDLEEIRALAAEIGYPVLLKPAAGGGGRGMRMVVTPSELESALQSAQDETRKAFGDDRIFLERFISNPRHIEIQIIADKHGNVVSLGERECSIQRRYQKLIEESPSPFITPELRREVGELAVSAARNVNYSNAGTMEFLFDDRGRYYFMEMNTRIQVEHPVTEMVTGIDMVKEQLRIAAREKLGYTQKDIQFRGHAIECRINAECPDTLLPFPGRITAFHQPGGMGVRVDTAAYHDYVITPYYDSLIAKMITFGRNRAEAISRMQRALDMTLVEGVKTTIPLHQRILDEEDFRAGRLSTRFLNRWFRF